MSYLLHAKKRNRNPIKKIIAVLVLCVILGFVARGFIVRTTVGVGGVFQSIVSAITPAGLRSDNELLAENEKFKNTIVELTADNADRNVLAEENANLKYELGRRSASKTSEKGILGVITERPAETPFDTFIIDAGVNEGIVIGDNVYFGNLVIGKVIDVGNAFAKVELFSSPGNTFSGTVSGSNIKIDAKGLGGGMFESLVPESSEVSVGDALILPSISSKVFGLVQSIENRESEGFKRLLFTLPVNPNQIYQVVISK